METVFDWLALAIFAGLVVLFLQRSVQEEPSDRIWQYAPPSIGCMAGNWLGNNDYVVAAIAVLVASVAFIVVVLRPFAQRN